MVDLDFVRAVAGGGLHLAVFATTRPDGSIQASLVNAGVIDDPVDGTPGVAIVAIGGSAKLSNLRRTGIATVVFTHGYQWASVSGVVRLIGPDDGGDTDLDLPEVIRSVFRAAGGDHEDWDEFDRVMAADRRCAVFVRADRISSNSGAGG